MLGDSNFSDAYIIGESGEKITLNAFNFNEYFGFMLPKNAKLNIS